MVDIAAATSAEGAGGGAGSSENAVACTVVAGTAPATTGGALTPVRTSRTAAMRAASSFLPFFGRSTRGEPTGRSAARRTDAFMPPARILDSSRSPGSLSWYLARFLYSASRELFGTGFPEP